MGQRNVRRLLGIIVTFWIVLLFDNIVFAAVNSNNVYTSEANSVVALRLKILQGPYGEKAIHEVVNDLLTAEGVRLQQVYLALAVRKQEAIPIVLEKLETGTPYQKRKISKLLRYGRWPETVPKLLQIASSNGEHEISRIGALYALGAIGKKSAGPTITAFLDEPERGPTEKRIIISTLARLKYRAAIPKIEEYLTHENLLVRIFSARALAELGQAIDVAILFEALQNEDYVIRQEACGAFGSVGGSNAAVKLDEISRMDTHRSVRRAAKLALNRIEMSSMSRAEKATFLVELLSDPDKKARSWAIRLLATECGEEGTTKLREIASQPTREGRKAADQLLMLTGASNNAAEEIKP